MTETTPAEREEQEAARRRERFGLLLCAILAAFVVQGVSTPNRFEARGPLQSALLARQNTKCRVRVDLNLQPRVVNPVSSPAPICT